MNSNVQSVMNFNPKSWGFSITLNKHHKQHQYVKEPIGIMTKFSTMSLPRQRWWLVWWDSPGTWGPEPGQDWVQQRPFSPLVDSHLAPVEGLD